MKKQLLYIHGGETFDNYNNYLEYLRVSEVDLSERPKRWKDNLAESLGDDFEVIMPSMPAKQNAKYIEWKIWFEKFIPFLKDNAMLVGHSLGGLFLAKYLSENRFSVRIKALFLIAAPFDNEGKEYSLADFDLDGDLSKIKNQTEKIFIYHSEDDFVVDFTDSEKYKKALPEAEMVIFNDRGHFLGEDFPELIENVKKL